MLILKNYEIFNPTIGSLCNSLSLRETTVGTNLQLKRETEDRKSDLHVSHMESQDLTELST